VTSRSWISVAKFHGRIIDLGWFWTISQYSSFLKDAWIEMSSKS
jgi:hypothetical protein